MNIRDAINAFDELQWEHADYGAADTEPREIFHGMLRRIARDGEVRIPGIHQAHPWDDGSNPWSLYSSMEGYERVSDILTQEAAKVAKLAVEDREGLEEYLKSEYGWF